MPCRCSILGCRSNYDKEKERFTTFSLPKDPVIREKWIRAIPTDLSKLKHPNVCIKHFLESDVIRVDKLFYKGELRDFERERPKLKDNAVPVLFESVLLNLSKPKVIARSLDGEQTSIEEAVKHIADHSIHIGKNKIVSFNDMWHALAQLDDSQKRWTFVQNESKDVSSEISPSKNATGNNPSSSSPVLRSTEDQRRRMKRKRTLDNEISSSIDGNGTLDINSVQHCLSNNTSETFRSQNHCENDSDLTNNAALLLPKVCELHHKETDDETETNAYDPKTGRILTAPLIRKYLKEGAVLSLRIGSKSLKSETSRETPEQKCVIISSAESTSNSEIEHMHPQKESKSRTSESCDTTVYKKRLKIDKRDEAFGKFVASEMSDLRTNPELYLKTKQSILKLLMEAHFELMNSNNSV